MKRCIVILLFALSAVACGAVTAAIQDDDNLDNIRHNNHIVPEEGYQWPVKERTYWPTRCWLAAPMEMHGLDPEGVATADSTAENDPFFRALLVVRNGYLVFEKYYHGGSSDQSTEVWSVTKSITSALVGIAIDQGRITSFDEFMVELMPDYVGFGEMTLEHVLTHQTGLEWNEASLQSWIQSRDWIEEALSRGFAAKPGTVLLYSSGNSHIVSGLILKSTGDSPGILAKQHLFEPLGIEFVPMSQARRYTDWSQLHEPLTRTWRQDNMGLEIGAFGLCMTAREMAKFGFLYLNRGMWDGEEIISRAWVEKSTRDYVLRSAEVGFGYYWVIYKRAGYIAFDADGWGGQTISVIPALDMVIVTKCDAVNPQGTSSYQVLNEILASVKE